MKKQLFTATLTLATIPFFTLSNVQPNKSALLAHLKSVQAIIEKDLKHLSSRDKELQQRLLPNSVLLTNIWNDFFDLSKLIQEYIKIEKIAFYRICHELYPIHDCCDIIDCADDIDEKTLIKLNIEEFNIPKYPQQNTNFSQFMNIILEKYFLTNDIQVLEKKMNDLIETEDSIDLGFMIIFNKMLIVLLQDIENKIRELS
ncbi:MAG TPA: hypothetical protein VHX42_01620 [Candidatus Babeliales bacterium]|jgi:hypothetical protein|nr:hypothetical protein [Candidatus Babeliales bacterium]